MDDGEGRKDGLSVNSLEIHTSNQIAAIYAEKFNEKRPVAPSTPTIEDYNRAAEGVGLMIGGYYNDEPHWTNPGPNGDEPSYKHDPKTGNDSHCLVRFTRLLDEKTAFLFAVRMAYKPTYREY
jgi:hypothetical protein